MALRLEAAGEGPRLTGDGDDEPDAGRANGILSHLAARSFSPATIRAYEALSLDPAKNAGRDRVHISSDETDSGPFPHLAAQPLSARDTNGRAVCRLT